MKTQFHIADPFETVVDAVPDRLAIQGHDESLTHRQLDTSSDALARGLLAQGIERGDHVGLSMRNRAEYPEAYLAAIKIGAVPVKVRADTIQRSAAGKPDYEWARQQVEAA